MPALTYWPQLFNAEQCQASIHTFRWKDVRWVVYLYTADKYDRLTCRSSENQKLICFPNLPLHFAICS
jgi:hypothetical protein